MKRLCIMLAAALMVAGCPESRPDDLEVTRRGGDQDTRTQPEDTVPPEDAASREATRPPDGEYGAHIVIHNGTDVDLYIPMEFAISIEQIVYGKVIARKIEHGCIPVCQDCEVYFCEACDPALRVIESGKNWSYDWDGYFYDHNAATCHNDELDADVACLDEILAPPATLHAKICFSDTFVPEEEYFGNCWGAHDVVSPATLGTTLCVSTKFHYNQFEPPSFEIVLSLDDGVEP